MIEINPPRLRNDAEILRQRARTIRHAIESVDQNIHSLTTGSFAGMAADAYRGRYKRAYSTLQAIDSVLLRFAAELEIAAERFERADTELGS